MKARNLKSAIWLILAVGATALAAGPGGGKPPGGGGGGGGGGGEEDTGSFKLSVPAVMIGGVAGGAICGTGAWSDLVPPSGDPKSGFPISPLDYYFVQGVNPWQAQCMQLVASPLGHNVTGAWGDNLVGDAKLKVGSPIRVELLLWDASTELHYGYEVLKLDPSALDRVAPYGVLATDTNGSYAAEPKYMTPVVHDAGASLTITGAGFSVSENPITPEINATGKVVYGYNLRVPAAGEYVITFKMPNVNLLTCDAGVCAGDTATLKITVGTGGGGGGGKKGGGRP